MEETKHKTDAEGKYSFTIPPDQVAKRYLYIELDVEAPNYAPRKHFGYALSMILKNEKIGGRPFFENVDMRGAKEITGVLKTPDDKPAANVKILAYSNTDKKSEMFEYGSFADARTDDAGRFRLWVVTPGPAYVWLLPEKFVPETHVLKDDKRGDLGTFILKDGVSIRGKVVDAEGQAVGRRERQRRVAGPQRGNHAARCGQHQPLGRDQRQGRIRDESLAARQLHRQTGPVCCATAPRTTARSARSRPSSSPRS